MKRSGFTLLEIMLVLLLVGVASAIVLPTLAPADSAARLRTNADRFAALVKAGHEESMILRKDLGISLSDDGYQFMIREQGQWQKLERDRMLTTQKLPDLVELGFTLGEPVWQAALEAEQALDENSLFESALLESEEQKKKKEPDLYLWSSGELTPAEIRFFSSRDSRRFFSVNLSETGDVQVVNGMDGKRS